MDKGQKLDYPIERHLTLRERIVEFIKDAVISGSLKPGERVPESEIAERFGISRTPIREAFRQLESEGFLMMTPRKGAVVSPITDKDVREFYAIKSLLEGYAAEQACIELTDKEIKKLQDLNDEMEKNEDKGNVKNFFKLDNQFHEVFIKASRNEKLCALIHQLVEQFERFRITALSLPGRMHNSVAQHKEIIEAIEDKNVALVSKLVRANAESNCEVLVSELLKESADNKDAN
ncbi:MAG: GntR family transcriptional regulator [Proteobacteria bacterium]|nr:GntR family transcriptional regulator [Pseudomonadota bacterium]